MKTFYAPLDFKFLAMDLSTISETNSATEKLKLFLKSNDESLSSEQYISQLSNLLETIHFHILDLKHSIKRLKLLDISSVLKINSLLNPKIEKLKHSREI